MKWVQDTSLSNANNINNVRCEATVHFRNKKQVYLKAKVDEFERVRWKTLGTCIGAYDFKKGYQPRTDIVKDEKGNLVADCNSILGRWRNHFSQLLNVHRVNGDNQTEVHTAGLVPEPSVFEFELATEELKRHKSSGIDQIPSEMLKTGGRKIPCETWTYYLFMFLWPCIVSKAWRKNTNKMQQYRWFIVNCRCWLLTRVSTCYCIWSVFAGSVGCGRLWYCGATL